MATTCRWPGAPGVLEGTVTDLEDGPVTDCGSFVWSSSSEGELGVGRTSYLDDLLPGPRTIVLAATDSDGFVSRDVVPILIGNRAYLLIVFRVHC